MSTSIQLPGRQEAWAPPAANPLDEAKWQAWLAKGRARERRGSSTRIKAVKWAAIVALLAAASLWSQLAPFDIVVRFVVTAAAMVVMFQAFRTKSYTAATVFGALAVLYNPVAPALHFSGVWQRAAVAASTLPFVASLAWRSGRTGHND